MKILSAVCAAGLAVAGLAFADTTTKSDPKGDTRGKPAGDGLDIKSGQAAHQKGKLVHTIVSWTKAGPDAVPLMIYVGKGKDPDFVAGKSRAGKLGIFDGKTGKRVGGYTIVKHSPKSFSYKFKPAAIGNPSKYQWRWYVTGQDGPYDTLPNKGLITHTLD
jgi:hypothetical protein